MNNNFYEIPNDWYNEFNNSFIPNMLPNTVSNDLSDPKNGFLRGNLFNNLYNPYKNYKYRDLVPTNKRDEVLYNILKYNFALTELELYLDTHPEDTNMISLYNKYLSEKKKLISEYEKNFGALSCDGLKDMNNWTWINSPWPWEMGN